MADRIPWAVRIAAPIAVVLAAGPAADLPVLHIRLLSDVSTSRSKPDDKIDAVSVAPLLSGGRVVATAGCSVPGTVVETLRPRGVNAREVVVLRFDQLIDTHKQAHRLAAQLVEVDNARESVDDEGRILGNAPVEEKPDDPVDVLKIAAHGIPIVRNLVSKLIHKVPPQIDYHPGTELNLHLTRPWMAPPADCGGPYAAVVPGTGELDRFANQQPLRAMSKAVDKPADFTNVMLLGTADALSAAFDAAGWKTAAEAGAQTSARTFFAVATGQGYSEGPVSLQTMDGKAPDAVFQKQLNTFAKRHHVRIWLRPELFHGQNVWLGAATHDNAIIFSREKKWFTHGIDPNIDAERDKIVNDLLFTRQVKSITWVDRPDAPHNDENAAGESIRTDGRIAVLVLGAQ